MPIGWIMSEDNIQLYQKRIPIYPRSVKGRFRNLKTGIMALAYIVYFLLPWLRWDRPNAPDQAVLYDLPGRHFYVFGLTIQVQDIFWLAGVLIIFAILLFFVTGLAGRVWCGYFCFQTLWTDLYMMIEHWVQGERPARMRLDKGPWNREKLIKRGGTYGLWLLVALWTGVTFTAYWVNAPTLIVELLTGQAPYAAYFTTFFLTTTTFVMAGLAREQVCVYMCPWPRIQASLTDEWALNVTYKYDRGETRTSLKKARDLRALGEQVGDCVDCYQCVAVCPTGIDIRDGAQLACIQCGLCIDACDNVMTKIGRPTRLIGYDNDINIQRRLAGKPEIVRLIRPRTIAYLAMIAAVGAVMLYALLTRTVLDISALHDRNPIAVRLSDGSIRNAYTVRLLNKRQTERTVVLDVEGVPNARLHVVGAELSGNDQPTVLLGPDRTIELRVLVTAPAAEAPKSVPVTFRVTDPGLNETSTTTDNFVQP